MLTTTDNPYDPRSDYALWLDWDHEQGYFTQEYLARIANVSADMNEYEAEPLLEIAMESILENDTLGIYKLV